MVRNRAGLRIYGNGIISSFAQTQPSLAGQGKMRPFLADGAAGQPGGIWPRQGQRFDVDSFGTLQSAFDDGARRNGPAGGPPSPPAAGV